MVADPKSTNKNIDLIVAHVDKRTRIP